MCIRDRPFAASDFTGYSSYVLCIHIDGEFLNRLTDLAVDFFGDHLGLANLKLVALSSQGLDKYREMKLAAAGEYIIAVLIDLHSQGDVGFQFPLDPLENLAAGNILPLHTGQRRSIGANGHLQGRLLDLDDRQHFGVVAVGDCLADTGVPDTGQRHDIASVCLIDLYQLQTLGNINPVDPCRLLVPVFLHQGDGGAGFYGTAPDPADGVLALVAVRVC